MNKGFVLTLESLIAFMFFCTALLFLFQPVDLSYKELIIVQQENDLLKIWSITFPSDNEAVSDCKKMFGENFDLLIDGKVLHTSNNIGEIYSSDALIIDDYLNEYYFEIRVYV